MQIWLVTDEFWDKFEPLFIASSYESAVSFIQEDAELLSKASSGINKRGSYSIYEFELDEDDGCSLLEHRDRFGDLSDSE